MGTKVITCILCCIVSSCAAASKDQYNYSNEIKYAVAYCLASSYPDSAFSNDARHISGAYLQKGSFGLDMYDGIRQYVATYREKPYSSKHGRNLEIMQCIDLYASKELATKIQKIAKSGKGWFLSSPPQSSSPKEPPL